MLTPFYLHRLFLLPMFHSVSETLTQWFLNCGTRTSSGTQRPSRWYTHR